MCGGTDDTGVYVFEYTIDNPVTHLTKLAGDVGRVADYLLSKNQEIQATFCRSCYKRFGSLKSKAELFHLLFVLVIFFTILPASVVGSFVSLDASLVIVAIGITSAIAVRIWAASFIRRSSPRFTKFTLHKAIVKIPGRGKVIWER
jgi:hypothetical protein